jgi:hypothetical protein
VGVHHRLQARAVLALNERTTSCPSEPFLGIWGWKATARKSGGLSPLFWLYVVAQAIFLGFFAGALTMKMAVLVEQTLMAAMIAMIGLRTSRAA